MTTPLMLFAAGFGTRMGALTRDRPKPLVEVAGRPLIDHALDLARDAGCGPVVVNTHYRAEMLAAHLAGRGVRISHEADRILDTGGGLKAALPMLGAGPVLTLNSDALFAGPNPLTLLRDAWEPERMDALLLCVPADRAIGRLTPGDFLVDDAGRIERGPGVVYTGAQMLNPKGLAAIDAPVFSLNRLWDGMMAEGRARALIYPGRWCDIGHPEGISLAESLLADV